jgi:hypothetical protein
MVVASFIFLAPFFCPVQAKLDTKPDVFYDVDYGCENNAQHVDTYVEAKYSNEGVASDLSFEIRILNVVGKCKEYYAQ